MNKLAANTTEKILPPNATAAVQDLIKMSKILLDLSEKETQTLLQNDMMGFAFIQDQKDRVVARYTKASEEFRSRIREFRTVNKALLDKLEELQNMLGEKSEANNLLVLRMKERSQRNTQKTLLTVQELAQKKPMRFDRVENQTQA